MPTALNYAQQYSQALAQAYPFVLHFAALRSTENDTRYKWTGANTIQIPSLSTTGRVDGDRDTISVATRNYNNAWEPKTLANHRKWSTLVHPLDIDETNQVASISNITRVFNEEQKFPEMDCYLISKLYADWVTAGGVVDNTVITTANVLTQFDAWMQAIRLWHKLKQQHHRSFYRWWYRRKKSCSFRYRHLGYSWFGIRIWFRRRFCPKCVDIIRNKYNTCIRRHGV